MSIGQIVLGSLVLAFLVMLVAGAVLDQLHYHEQNEKKRKNRVNINQFAVLVTQKEGLKKSISIAQVKEVLKIVNKLTCGYLYRAIRSLEE